MTGGRNAGKEGCGEYHGRARATLPTMGEADRQAALGGNGRRGVSVGGGRRLAAHQEKAERVRRTLRDGLNCPAGTWVRERRPTPKPQGHRQIACRRNNRRGAGFERQIRVFSMPRYYFDTNDGRSL